MWHSGGGERGQSQSCSKSPAPRARPFPPSVVKARGLQGYVVMAGLGVAGVGEADGGAWFLPSSLTPQQALAGDC